MTSEKQLVYCCNEKQKYICVRLWGGIWLAIMCTDRRQQKKLIEKNVISDMITSNLLRRSANIMVYI